MSMMQIHHSAPAPPLELAGPWGYFVKVLKCVGIISLIWFPNYFGTPGNLFSYAILVYMASRSTEGALKAMLISSLIINGNSFFMHLTSVAAMGRFLVLGVAALRVFYDASRSGRTLRGGLHIGLLVGFVAICSMGALIGQYFVMVSMLKLLVFLLGAYIVLCGPYNTRIRHDVLTLWFFSAAVFVIVGSILLYPTGLGYFKDEEVILRMGLSLYCGIMNHSQTFGVGLVMVYVYILSLYLFSNFPLRKWLPLFLFAILGLVYLTDSRTALATIFGASFLGIWLFSLVRYRAQVLGMFKRLRILILVAVLAVIGYVVKEAYFSPQPFAAVMKYVSKGRGTDLSADELLSGRNLIAQSSFRRFLDNPVFGIGFGTDLSYEFQARARWYTAPTEKSFIPTAVLEETGLAGGTLFTAFVCAFLVFLYRTPNMPGLLAFIVMLVLNLGEMMFFSFGGLGAFVWVFVCGTILIGDPRSFRFLRQQSRF